MEKSDLTKAFPISESAVPCGTAEFMCGETPRITFISDTLLKLLKYTQASKDALEICRQNIYTIIAPKDRSKFSESINISKAASAPGPQRVDLICFDGSTIGCLAWITVSESTCQVSFVEITSWLKRNSIAETEKYVKVLSEIYSDIFEFDYSSRTVKAVYSKRSAMLRWIKDVPMQMEDATKKWILHKVPAEEVDKLQAFMNEDPSRKNASAKQGEHDKETRMQIHYHVMSSDGTLWRYLGVFVPGSGSTWLFCCRKDPEYSAAVSEPYSGPKVRIRTFGYFDVFVGETPVAFRNEKSKELLALLVDRKGGYVSADEAISFLWEDSPADALTLSRYRKVALRLKRTLEEYGISEIIESVNGKRRIVTDRVQCDLYEYLSGKEEFTGLFKGSYLSNYSWAENTLAELLQSSGTMKI